MLRVCAKDHPEQVDEIFLGTYWAAGKMTEQEAVEIFENRRRLKQELNLVSTAGNFRKRDFVSKYLTWTGDCGLRCDHVEYYKDAAGDIWCLSSPYGDWNEEAHLRYGFRRVDPVYNHDARSYVRKLVFDESEPWDTYVFRHFSQTPEMYCKAHQETKDSYLKYLRSVCPKEAKNPLSPSNHLELTS